MTNPRYILNWLTARLDDLEKDTLPVDSYDAWQSFLRDYVLPDIDAKRRILAEHQPHNVKVGRVYIPACTKCVKPIVQERDGCNHQPEEWPCNAIREAAVPFYHQAGYLVAWVPDNANIRVNATFPRDDT